MFRKYIEKIKRCDEYVKNILDSIEEREKNYKEDWLVLLTTDHGRDFKGVTHGK